MAGSVYVVIAIVLAGLIYLVLRRRSSPQAEEATRSGTVGSVATGTTASEPDLKPYRPTAPAGTRTGLPPRSMSPDSGSSHPAYPVAPAKYAGGPGKSALTSRPDYSPTDRPSGTMAAATPRQEPQVDPGANAPPATKPWYPEAPADYTGDDGSVSAGDEAAGR